MRILVASLVLDNNPVVFSLGGRYETLAAVRLDHRGGSALYLEVALSSRLSIGCGLGLVSYEGTRISSCRCPELRVLPVQRHTC